MNPLDSDLRTRPGGWSPAFVAHGQTIVVSE
jgi:hypothetical protein